MSKLCIPSTRTACTPVDTVLYSVKYVPYNIHFRKFTVVKNLMLGLFWFGARVGGSGEEILDRPLSNFDVIGIPTSKEMMVMMMMMMMMMMMDCVGGV